MLPAVVVDQFRKIFWRKAELVGVELDAALLFAILLKQGEEVSDELISP